MFISRLTKIFRRSTLLCFFSRHAPPVARHAVRRVPRPASLVPIFISLVMFSTLASAEEPSKPAGSLRDGDQVYIINNYRFESDDPDVDPDLGHSLCSTRCNALAYDYLNILATGGYRMFLIARDREMSVDLNNPFISGHCICTVDEYIINRNTLNWQRKP